jgi:hypothetical protein
MKRGGNRNRCSSYEGTEGEMEKIIEVNVQVVDWGNLRQNK